MNNADILFFCLEIHLSSSQLGKFKMIDRNVYITVRKSTLNEAKEICFIKAIKKESNNFIYNVTKVTLSKEEILYYYTFKQKGNEKELVSNEKASKKEILTASRIFMGLNESFMSIEN